MSHAIGSIGTEVIVVRTFGDVVDLVEVVRDQCREGAAIVALTSRMRERQPALDPVQIREVVGPDCPVYVLATGPLTRDLEELLPPRLHVFGGAARIWWPPVDSQSHPDDHPLIHEPYATYGTKALETFRWRFENGPPSSRRSVTDQRVSLAQREREEDRWRLRELQRTVYGIKQERDRALRRAEVAEKRDRERPRKTRGSAGDPCKLPEADPLTAFRRAVVEAWLETFGEGDRSRYPIGAYVIGNSFLASIGALPEAVQERIPRVCAMVLSGRAHELSSLALHRLRVGPAGDSPPRIRHHDGAVAWRCAIKRNTPAAARLHYWRCPNGVIELARAGHHDDHEIPE